MQTLPKDLNTTINNTTINDKIIEIIMVREAEPNSIFVYFEGDTDVNLFKIIMNHEFRDIANLIKLESSKGKQKAKKIVKKAKEEKLKNVIAFLDADFDRKKNPALDDSDDLIYTDQNDLECTILNLGALNHNHMLYDIFFDKHALNDFLSNLRHQNLFDLLIQLSSKIGWLRFQNFIKNLGLDFKGLPYPDLFLEPNFEFDKSKFYECLTKNNSNKHDSALLKSKIEILNNHDKMEVPQDIEYCNGHDICELISLITKRLGGRESWGPKLIESMIKVWFSNPNYYEGSPMITKLKNRLTRID